MSTLEGFGSLRDWSYTIWELHPPVLLLQGHGDTDMQNILLLLSSGPKSLSLGARTGNWGLPHVQPPPDPCQPQGNRDSFSHKNNPKLLLGISRDGCWGLVPASGSGQAEPFPSQKSLCFQHQSCAGMQAPLEVWEAPGSSCWFRWADSPALSQQESQGKGGAQRSQMGRRGSPVLWKAIRRSTRVGKQGLGGSFWLVGLTLWVEWVVNAILYLFSWCSHRPDLIMDVQKVPARKSWMLSPQTSPIRARVNSTSGRTVSFANQLRFAAWSHC